MFRLRTRHEALPGTVGGEGVRRVDGDDEEEERMNRGGISVQGNKMLRGAEPR